MAACTKNRAFAIAAAELPGHFVAGMGDEVKIYPEIGVAHQSIRRPQQFELHGVSAFVAGREAVGVEQRDFMGEAVAPVMRAINATQGDRLAWTEIHRRDGCGRGSVRT